jgi:hypothetical protein
MDIHTFLQHVHTDFLRTAAPATEFYSGGKGTMEIGMGMETGKGWGVESVRVVLFNNSKNSNEDPDKQVTHYNV